MWVSIYPIILILPFTMNVLNSNLFVSSFFPVLEISLLLELFKNENIHHALNFHCNSVQTEISVQKLFYKNDVRITSKQVGNDSYEIPLKYPRIGFIVNSSCENWEIVLRNFNSVSYLRSPYYWFIITDDFLSIIREISQYPIEVNSEVTIIHKSEDNENTLQLYEAYNTGFYTHGKFVIKKIGVYNTSLHLEKRNRMDLSGVVLRAPVVVTHKVVNETFEEFVERSKLSKSDTLHKNKYFTLLKFIRDLYNFSYILTRTNSWGYLTNGSFDGLIGALQRHEADIGGSPIFFRLERATVLDYTIEVWPSKPVFIMRHPKHPGGYITIFTRPLTSQVWGSIIITLATAGLLLCAMSRVKILQTDTDHNDTSLSLAWLTIWSAICQQGTAIGKGASSIKLVMFVTFVFTLTIYQYYNATVVSSLLRDPPKTIRTSTDLLRSDLKTGVHDVLYNKDFFKRTTDPIALEMYSKKIVTPTANNFFPLEYGVGLVKKGGFAFLVDNSIAYGIMRRTFTERELCEAHEVSLYPPQNLVAVVKKGSPYKEHFSYGLRKMFEAGLMKRIKSVWDEPRPSCVRTPDSSLIAVSLREFSMALIVLFLGAIIALVMLLWETVASNNRKKKVLGPKIKSLRPKINFFSCKVRPRNIRKTKVVFK